LAIGGIYGINIAPFEHYNAAADEIERLRKQRDELVWAIAWFLNGGSREKLEQRFKDYEATL